MRSLLLSALLLLSLRGWSLEIDLDKSAEGSGAVLVANGVLGLKDARAFAKILDERAEKGERTIILLTSHGGILEVIRAIGDALIKASNTLHSKHQKSNIFAVNTECSSACTVLTGYLTSKRDSKALEIKVDEDSVFGIHGPKGGKEAEDKQITAYLSVGVKADWVQKNDAKLRQTKMTELKARTLCAEKINIIPYDSCWNHHRKGDLVEALKKNLGIVYDEP
jgi:hypothetical protein